jgi:hypothetical protein
MPPNTAPLAALGDAAQRPAPFAERLPRFAKQIVRAGARVAADHRDNPPTPLRSGDYPGTARQGKCSGTVPRYAGTRAGGMHPISGKIRRSHTCAALRSVQCRCGGGTAAPPRRGRRAHALRAVKQFAWLEHFSVS